MTVKHLLIFVFANCSVIAGGERVHSENISHAGNSTLINHQSEKQIPKSVTRIVSILSNTIYSISYSTFKENKNTTIGDYLFDVFLKVRKGDYEKYVLNDLDDKVSKKELKKRTDPVHACTWV